LESTAWRGDFPSSLAQTVDSKNPH